MSSQPGRKHPAGVLPTAGGRWKAIWRDPQGRQRSATFRRQEDAKSHRNKMLVDRRQGAYTDPARTKITLSAYWPTFLETRADKAPATLHVYEQHFRRYIEPAFGHRRLSDIQYEQIAAWLAAMNERGVGEATRRAAFKVLKMILRVALTARRIGLDPSLGIAPPGGKQNGKPKASRALTRDELERLVEATDTRSQTLVRFLAFTGLRIGEAAALRVRHLDLLHGLVLVRDNAPEVGGRLNPGETKTAHSRRDVPIAPWLAALLEEETVGKGPNDLVFSAPNGGMIYRTTLLRRVLAPACQHAGIGKVRTHDLRHTAGDLALKNGATMEDVKAMLGHASIAITIDIYGHRDEDDAQSIRDAMDRAHRASPGRSSPIATMRGSG